MKTNLTKSVIALSILLFLSNLIFAQTKVTNAGGDWFNPAIWSPAGVPFMADSVIINHHVTFNQTLDARPAAQKMFKVNLNASLKSVGADDSLILGVDDYLINRGEINAQFIAWGDINIYASNTGTIKATKDIAESDVFYNEAGALLQTGFYLSTSGNFLNKTNAKIIAGVQLNTSGDFTNQIGAIIVVTTSLVTSDDLLNNGDITTSGWINSGYVTGTTGRFCVANNFINAQNIAGTVDICDATPNTMYDINSGTIALSVTYCQNGPCAQVITGIKQNEQPTRKLNIFPNPSNGKFFMSAEQGMQIKVFNDLAEEVFKGNASNDFTEIDLSKQSKGIYFLEIFDGKNYKRQKVIIE